MNRFNAVSGFLVLFLGGNLQKTSIPRDRYLRFVEGKDIVYFREVLREVEVEFISLGVGMHTLKNYLRTLEAKLIKEDCIIVENGCWQRRLPASGMEARGVSNAGDGVVTAVKEEEMKP